MGRTPLAVDAPWWLHCPLLGRPPRRPSRPTRSLTFHSATQLAARCANLHTVHFPARMPLVTTGLRERKKRATRLALHRAALELVGTHGLDGVSIEQIAARADVSTRTFFNYFSTKEDAVIGTVPTTREDWVQT